jgi:hypothetical protein
MFRAFTTYLPIVACLWLGLIRQKKEDAAEDDDDWVWLLAALCLVIVGWWWWWRPAPLAPEATTGGFCDRLCAGNRLSAACLSLCRTHRRLTGPGSPHCPH